MHNQIIGSTAMDQDSHIAQDNSYGNENWVDMNSYHHQTTMPDYGGGFGYMPPINTPHGLPSLPSESLNRMPPPPPPQPQTTHAQLPMLMMPHATWPSMLTNPNNYGPHSAPPVAIPPVTAPLKPSKLPAIQTSQPRKTLTDEDRRQMCQYAEDHPGVKQTDIGARFGVERSTVSKVLRHKEKYLGQEDRSSSPIKRTKGKGADIEKALLNYVKNAQKTGVAVTSDDLKVKARLFATTTIGSGADAFSKTGSSAWLDKFMLKHGIGHGKLMRRASETNIPDSARASPSLSASQPSSAISPASPSGHLSPSPLSANRSDEDKESIGNFMDFNSAPGGYKHANSQSTTSLSSAFTDTAASSFSGSALSPTASFNFSPDPNVGGFLSADQSRQIPPGGAASNFQRPRSQTFPTLDLEYMNQPQTSEPLTPKYHVSSTAPSSALESPANDVTGSHFNLDHAVTSPQLRHSSSNSSIAGRAATSATASAVGSSPSSPTQEDARRAADTLLSFIQSANGFVDQHEYMAVVRLTEKLRLHQNQLVKAMSHGMGGLSRIPEGDSEMTNAPPVSMKVETTMAG